MVDLWVPGIEHYPIDAEGGGSLIGGPPRCTEHVTADAPNANGVLPPFAALRRYFPVSKPGNAPHIVADPCSGERVQYFPANVAARALVHDTTLQTNRFGTYHIQIEWRFSKLGRCPVHGVVHANLHETPMLGQDVINVWLQTLGIPSAWALGREPNWSRDTATPNQWLTLGGHYGHSQIPENDHVDPGPMPLVIVGPIPEDDMAARLFQCSDTKVDPRLGVITAATGPRWIHTGTERDYLIGQHLVDNPTSPDLKTVAQMIDLLGALPKTTAKKLEVVAITSKED